MNQLSNMREWIMDFHDGNEAAFKAVFDTYHNRLVFFAFQMIDRQDVAEDLVLEAFGKLYDDRAKFRTADHIKAFLFAATRNSCLNHLKHIRRKAASHKELKYLLEERNDEVEMRIIYGDLLKRISEELQLLPESQRRIIQLAYMEGYKNEEIAEQLSLPHATVRVYKGRALELLQTALSQKEIHIGNALLTGLLAGAGSVL